MSNRGTNPSLAALPQRPSAPRSRALGFTLGLTCVSFWLEQRGDLAEGASVPIETQSTLQSCPLCPDTDTKPALS